MDKNKWFKKLFEGRTKTHAITPILLSFLFII